MKSFFYLLLCVMLIILGVIYINSVFAEPVVIYDSGRGESTYPYRQLFGPMSGEAQSIQDSWIFGELPKEDEPIAERQTIDWSFPLVSKKLSSKRMDQAIEGYFPRMMFPVCIVGDDALSLEWLSKNRETLASINAQCFIVSAASSDSVKPLLRLLDGIIAYPADGDAIADYFKIEHYPVLITERHASQ